MNVYLGMPVPALLGSSRRSKNSPNKPFKCQYPNCDKSFFQSSHLLHHQTLKHGRIPKGRRERRPIPEAPRPILPGHHPIYLSQAFASPPLNGPESESLSEPFPPDEKDPDDSQQTDCSFQEPSGSDEWNANVEVQSNISLPSSIPLHRVIGTNFKLHSMLLAFIHAGSLST